MAFKDMPSAITANQEYLGPGAVNVALPQALLHLIVAESAE